MCGVCGAQVGTEVLGTTWNLTKSRTRDLEESQGSKEGPRGCSGARGGHWGGAWLATRGGHWGGAWLATLPPLEE